MAASYTLLQKTIFFEINFEFKIIFSLKSVRDNAINLIFVSESIIIFNNTCEIIRCGEFFLKKNNVIEFTATFTSMYFFFKIWKNRLKKTV